MTDVSSSVPSAKRLIFFERKSYTLGTGKGGPTT
jgi:hypothetical protein